MNTVEVSKLKAGSLISDWSAADGCIESVEYNKHEVIEVRGFEGVLLKNLDTGSESFQSLVVLLSDETRVTVSSKL